MWMFKSTKAIPIIVASLMSFTCAYNSYGDQSNTTKSAILMSPELDKSLFEGLRTSRKFDSNLWIHGQHLSGREGMVPDLIRRYPLIGMSRSDVHSLLGPPRQHDAFTDADAEYYDLPLYDGMTCGAGPARFLEFAY